MKKLALLAVIAASCASGCRLCCDERPSCSYRYSAPPVILSDPVPPAPNAALMRTTSQK